MDSHKQMITFTSLKKNAAVLGFEDDDELLRSMLEEGDLDGDGCGETKEEIVRCIQIGLLCVQEYPKDRPSIEMVLSMLSRDIVELPLPKQPVFAENGSTPGSGSTNQNVFSNNELTLSVLDGR
ncbi:hypothetical protein SASPL_144591 [Salvia splendens]|uniref:S-locus receptor kinase C-terminal domain-containing protein n=1 Tax=Salvia splendens TaxID=180675 RepID=A0A8X8WFZ7_SALSN|nr:hypothetical protein SASPL_144591 [Salvia splendens]